MRAARPVAEQHLLDPRTVGRRRSVTLLVLVVLLLISEGLIALSSQRDATPWWIAALFIVFPLAAAIACYRAARRLEGNDRKAWLYFGTGCAAFAI